MKHLFIILFTCVLCGEQELYSFVNHYEKGDVDKFKADNIVSFEMAQGMTESGVSKNTIIKCLGYEDGFLLLEETMTDLVAVKKNLGKMSADHKTNSLIGIPYTIYVDTLSGLIDHIETDYKEYENLIKSTAMGPGDMENKIYPYGKNAINIKVGDSWSPPPDTLEMFMGDQGNANYMIFNSIYTLVKVKQKKGINIAYITGKYKARADVEFLQDSNFFEGTMQGTMKDKIRYNVDEKKEILNKLSCTMDWDLKFEGENMSIRFEMISNEKRIK